MTRPNPLLRQALAAAGWLTLMSAVMPVSAQQLPPIYEHTPVAIAAAATVVEYGKGAFLENIAIGKDAALFVNNYLEGKVYRIDRDGKSSVWASVDGTIAGIALNPDGSALLSGWIAGKEPAVFAVDPSGHASVLMRLPGAQFPNGVVRMAADRYLVADSYKGLIWLVDTERRTSEVWLQDDSLARASTENPTPAVNGIKLHAGALYASNTAKQLLVKIPVTQGRAGRPEVWMKDIGLDDFDFDDSGALYGATHVYNSLVRVGRDGKVTVLAGLAQGMAGSTAVACSPAGDGQVYVTTNGGVSLPPPGGVQSGKVVRVSVSRKP